MDLDEPREHVMSAASSNREIKLAEIISPQTTRARVAVNSWQEATEFAGELLVSAGKVHSRYVDAMKRVLQEIGPYAVIAPGIVLLHARPEDGVIEPCLGLITLATPVPFGHPENDPVDVVFALGAIDKHSHILALQQLANMLGDELSLMKIRSATEDGELYDILNSQNHVIAE